MRGRAVAARRAHNPEVAGSNPVPAIRKKKHANWRAFFIPVVGNFYNLLESGENDVK